MEDDNKIVNQLLEKQIKLKKEIKSLKKRVPRIVLGLVFITAILYNLAEGKFNSLFGNNTNLMIFSFITVSILSSIYLVTSFLKLSSLKKESKKTSSKLYDLTRLKE